MSLTDGGNYSVVITNLYGSVTSSVATLYVGNPPTISTEPASQTAWAGSNVTLHAGPAGVGPFTYQWLFNGKPISGATNSSLILSNLQSALSGTYAAIVDNAGGSVTSSIAVLTVVSSPLIIQQPASQTNLPGTNVTLSVTVSGTGPLTYQWQFNGTNLPNGIITTVAGGGTNVLGDGGPATNASLSAGDVAVDAIGNLFIAGYGRIRKVDTSGIITTVAGNGSSGYSGDGGAATNARLAFPAGVAVDGSGNLFIADNGNERIRKVATNGVIMTVAGNGQLGYSGDGGAATNASLSLASNSGWNASVMPSGLAVDSSGNLFIADYHNNRIRKIGTNGVITTVAGNGSSGYSGDGGAATNAGLVLPSGVAVDGSGNLFIADGYAQIRKVGTNGVITSLVPYLPFHTSVAVDGSGNLFIDDGQENRVLKVDTSGTATSVAGNGSFGYSGDGGAATKASLLSPASVAVDGSGTLFIADQYESVIREVPLGGRPILTVANITPSTAGGYQVIVTGPYGSVTSAVASLTLNKDVPPIITQQPRNLVVAAGDSAVFSITANAAPPLSYYWLFNQMKLSGLTNTSLILTNVQPAQAGMYAVVVSNPAGSVTSSIAVLTVVSLDPRNAGVSGRLNGIIFDGAKFLVVGDGGTIITSPNGTDWTSRNSGVTSTLFGIAQGTTNFVAVGASGTVLLSPDGIHWVRQNSSITFDLHGVAFGPSGFVAVGGGDFTSGANAIISSIDGVSWATRNLPVAPVGPPLSYLTYGLMGIVYAPNGYVAVGSCEFGYLNYPTVQSFYGIIFSPDGINWADKRILGLHNGSTPIAFGVFNGNNRYVIVGEEWFFSGTGPQFQDSFLTSTTGTTWTESAQPLAWPVCATAGTFGNGTYVAVGNGGAILASSDAANWTVWPSGPTNNLNAVTYGNGTFVAVGDGGAALQFAASSSSSQNPLITMNVPTISGNNLLLGFTLSQTVGGTLTLLQSPSITGPWATNTGAVLTTNAQTGLYQFSLPLPASVEFYEIGSP